MDLDIRVNAASFGFHEESCESPQGNVRNTKFPLPMCLRCLDAEWNEKKRESRSYHDQKTPLWQENGTRSLDSDCDSHK